ncbi:hypothetical protein ROZALSC1DRAFT_19977 [Rozella allomycis CSF55]|uniref:Uncharacterized protein n=1 Tax=Rozella allomycis (strain CSF55) TaxID=988480 RepID=A0A4P9YSE7_ROZAC|nr:hypothetical protein ROZALSC1DRAFT_19977 [Rozella allomycis CSF55]
MFFVANCLWCVSRVLNISFLIHCEQLFAAPVYFHFLLHLASATMTISKKRSSWLGLVLVTLAVITATPLFIINLYFLVIIYDILGIIVHLIVLLVGLKEKPTFKPYPTQAKENIYIQRFLILISTSRAIFIVVSLSILWKSSFTVETIKDIFDFLISLGLIFFELVPMGIYLYLLRKIPKKSKRTRFASFTWQSEPIENFEAELSCHSDLPSQSLPFNTISESSPNALPHPFTFPSKFIEPGSSMPDYSLSNKESSKRLQTFFREKLKNSQMV